MEQMNASTNKTRQRDCLPGAYLRKACIPVRMLAYERKYDYRDLMRQSNQVILRDEGNSKFMGSETVMLCWCQNFACSIETLRERKHWGFDRDRYIYSPPADSAGRCRLGEAQ